MKRVYKNGKIHYVPTDLRWRPKRHPVRDVVIALAIITVLAALGGSGW